MKNLVPKDKFDIHFIENLKGKKINEIQNIVPQLLEWLQDGNWPVSRYVTDYLLPHVNEIQKDIISILKGEDEIWKYWVLLCLVYNSPNQLSDEILSEVKYIRDNATNLEKEADVEQLAIEILEKFNIN